MPRIACLHTAASNAALFEAALGAAGRTDVSLHHDVRPDLLDAAERAGGLTPEISADTIEALHTLAAQADAVLLTCSTLGPAAQAASATVPILRVDSALAAEAVRNGGRIVVLCAVDTTIQPTRALFEAAAEATGASVEIRLVPDAWTQFKAGYQDRYWQLIAAAVDQAHRDGAARIVLAQASMAGAADLVAAEHRPLTSPQAGLLAALAACP